MAMWPLEAQVAWILQTRRLVAWLAHRSVFSIPSPPNWDLEWLEVAGDVWEDDGTL